jgi:translation elongation factor EF-1alpha
MNQLGLIKKTEIAKCMEISKNAMGWTQYFVDVTYDERKSGCSKEMAKVSFEDGENLVTMLDTPGHQQ